MSEKQEIHGSSDATTLEDVLDIESAPTCWLLKLQAMKTDKLLIVLLYPKLLKGVYRFEGSWRYITFIYLLRFIAKI